MIQLTDGIPRNAMFSLAEPATLSVLPGETLCIFGANGAGKTLLCDMLTGAHPLRQGTLTYNGTSTDGGVTNKGNFVRHVTFRDAYSGSSAPAYYQQRWNHGDEMVFPTVAEVMPQTGNLGETLMQGIDRSKQTNWLSSGELRRMSLARMLQPEPNVLIVDEPFIGLDASARATWLEALHTLSRKLTLITVVTRLADIPPFTTHVVLVEGKRIIQKTTYAAFIASKTEAIREVTPVGNDVLEEVASLAARSEIPVSDEVVSMENVSVTYEGHTILRPTTWQVRRGDCWALKGANGAGKSTLLSLVCADNPMAYACRILLFGNRRGHGESIWDIKRHIGYVSPELFNAYNRPLPVIDLLASGLRDTVGLYRKPTEAERDSCRVWLRIFGIENLVDRIYTTLSSGERRMVLLARTFVKCPALLVLDEPFHGLDDENRQRATRIIETYLADGRHTLLMVSHYDGEFPPCVNKTLILEKNN